MSLQDSEIQGNASISRNANIGGHARINGDATVGHNLTVRGWVDAPNIKGACKGLYASEDALKAAYPRPQAGWYALVGDGLPAAIWRAERGDGSGTSGSTTSGRWEWKETGESGGDTIVDLTYYDDVISEMVSDLAATKTAMENLEHPVSLKDTDLAPLIIADENENILVTFSEGHIRTPNFDSSTLSELLSGGGSGRASLPGKWCAIGTSVTYWDKERRGYQSCIKEWMHVEDYVNLGVWGGTIVDLTNALSTISTADVYTIEHGINDWRTSTPLGTRQDFINNTGASTFYGAYRKVIDYIYALNKRALIVLMTPVKACGGYGLPTHTYDAINGVYFDAYVEAIKEIGKICSLPVADIYTESGINQWNLDIFSADYAIHPNEAGHKRMATVLYKTLCGLYKD